MPSAHLAATILFWSAIVSGLADLVSLSRWAFEKFNAKRDGLANLPNATRPYLLIALTGLTVVCALGAMFAYKRSVDLAHSTSAGVPIHPSAISPLVSESKMGVTQTRVPKANPPKAKVTPIPNSESTKGRVDPGLTRSPQGPAPQIRCDNQTNSFCGENSGTVNINGEKPPPNRKINLAAIQPAIELLETADRGAQAIFVPFGQRQDPEIMPFMYSLRNVFASTGGVWFSYDIAGIQASSLSYMDDSGNTFRGEGIGCTVPVQSKNAAIAEKALEILGFPCRGPAVGLPPNPVASNWARADIYISVGYRQGLRR